MPGFLLPIGLQFFDDDGHPLAGGKLSAFAAGTSTPLAIYTDQALSIAHANPAILDANGRLTAWMSDGVSYKFHLKHSTDVTVTGYPIDLVSVPDIAAPAAAAEVPTGAILPYGGATAPTGYLLCDGTAVSRSTYAALFAILSTAYGVGNGSTTFNLPDLRQRFPLGKAVSGTGATLGSTGGTIDHVHAGGSHSHGSAGLSVPSSGAHTHVTGTPVEAAADIQLGAGEAAAASPHTHNIASSGAHTHTLSGSTDAAGTGNTGTANAPFATVNFVIKM